MLQQYLKIQKQFQSIDREHSHKEDRWITMGLTANSSLLVVHHTYEQIYENTVIIRLISSRKATKNEKKQYTEL